MEVTEAILRFGEKQKNGYLDNIFSLIFSNRSQLFLLEKRWWFRDILNNFDLQLQYWCRPFWENRCAEKRKIKLVHYVLFIQCYNIFLKLSEHILKLYSIYLHEYNYFTQTISRVKQTYKYTGSAYLLKISVLKFARRNRMLKVDCIDGADDRQEMEISSTGIYTAYEIGI